MIGSGRGYSQGAHGGAGGGMMNKVESAIGMDLNGDGRVGGGMGPAQQYNQYGGQGYPPNNNQYGGPGPQNYGQYGGAPCYQNGPQYGGPGYGQNPQQGGGGGGLMNQLENMTGMDFNGDGRVGNQQGHRY